jgi:hypothetical protein
MQKEVNLKKLDWEVFTTPTGTKEEDIEQVYKDYLREAKTTSILFTGDVDPEIVQKYLFDNATAISNSINLVNEKYKDDLNTPKEKIKEIFRKVGFSGDFGSCYDLEYVVSDNLKMTVMVNNHGLSFSIISGSPFIIYNTVSQDIKFRDVEAIVYYYNQFRDMLIFEASRLY